MSFDFPTSWRLGILKSCVRAGTILASVLFFAGISTVLKSKRVRVVLLGGGLALWIGSMIYMVTLPVTSL